MFRPWLEFGLIQSALYSKHIQVMASAVANIGFLLQPNYVNAALARDQRFSEIFQTAAPRELQFNDILNSPSGSNQWMETLADNGVAFTPSNTKFTVTLRNASSLEFAYATLDFQASCTASDSSPVFFQQGIWNLINRVRVLSGSVVLMDQLEKNVFESFQYAFSRASNFDATIGHNLQGIGSIAQRQGWAAGNSYQIPLNIPLLTSELFVMGNNNGIVIEFYLASARSAVCFAPSSDPSATVNYTITNPRIRCHEVIYQDDLQRSILTLSPIAYPFVNYKYFSSPLASGSPKVQINIPVKVQSLIRLVCFMRSNSDMENPAATDILTTGFNYNNCLEYQLKVDNTYYPPQALSAGGQSGAGPAFIEMLMCMNRAELSRLDAHRDQNNGSSVWKNWDRVPLSVDDFKLNRFAMCIDLKSTLDNDPNYLQRFDTNPGNVTITLTANFQSGYPLVAQTLHIFAIHSSIVNSDTQGNYMLIE